ncbi:unnamed protein product [Echinostoma caproni]|uniref:DUF5808 domain-containing protein n=1 Tax=Echinostoma caproni TaxID=27848 RepID=A0A183B9Y7_9TREM|nr:unnamed protein product [Echinostoma caproni]
MIEFTTFTPGQTDSVSGRQRGRGRISVSGGGDAPNDPGINFGGGAGYYPRLPSFALFIPDLVGLDLLKAWGRHPQWTIWFRQWLLGAVVSTVFDPMRPHSGPG